MPHDYPSDLAKFVAEKWDNDAGWDLLPRPEILEQILRVDRLLRKEERITNIVVMGMGEPLANLKNLLPALDTLNEKGGLGLGARRITISTVGLPEKMRELARHGTGNGDLAPAQASARDLNR